MPVNASSFVRATVSARPVAIARVAVGTAAVLKAPNAYGYLVRWLEPDRLRMPYLGSVPVAPPELLFVLWLAAAGGFLLGWKTRHCGAFLAAVVFYFLALDRQLFGNSLYLLGLVVLLLTLTDAGAYGSVDALRRHTRERVPAWPVVLIKCVISLMYAYAAIAKLSLVYLSGAVIAVNARNAAIPLPELSPHLYSMLAVISMVAEAFLAGALWTPRLRRHAVALGVALHVCIVLTMGSVLQLTVFALVATGCYVLFFDPPRGSPGVLSSEAGWDRCGWEAGTVASWSGPSLTR